MKTTKILSALMFAIIAISTTAYSNGIDSRRTNGTAMPGITYEVGVHLTVLTKDFCNPYVIQIIDENGRIVAPAQVYNSAVSKYVFRERGPVTGKVRIAVMIPVSYPHHFICPIDLFTAPDTKNGPFMSGHSYSFNLYPVIQENTRESDDNFTPTRE